MLEILALTTIDEILYGYQLELPDDIDLNFIWENPLFLTDRIPAAYTLDFEAPPTPNNLLFFNFPNRVAITNVKSSCPVIIKHSGINIASGELILIRFDETLMLQFVGSIDPLDLKTNLNQIQLNTVELEGIIPTQANLINLDYNTADWDYFRAEILNASTADPTNERPYVIAPVKIDSASWEGEEYMRGTINSFNNYINFFNAYGSYNDFYIWDGWTTPANQIKAHSPMVPFISLREIVNKAFGEILLSNPFNSEDFSKLVLVCNNHEKYTIENLYKTYIRTLPSGNTRLVECLIQISDDDTDNAPVVWELQNFLQKYPFIEFLKNIMKIFGLSLFRGIKYRLEFDNDIMARSTVVNFDSLLDGEMVLTRLPARDYFFSYQGKTLQTSMKIKGEGNWLQVYYMARGSQVNVEYFYKITGTNQIVGLTKTLRGINSPDETYPYGGQFWISSRIVNSPLSIDSTKQYDEEPVNVVSEVTPLDINIEKYWYQNNNWQTNYGAPGDIILKRHWVVPLMPVMNPEDPPSIMIFAGRRRTINNPFVDYDYYPMLTNHNIDNIGSVINSFSLLPDGVAGITNTFHTAMKAWYGKERLEAKGYFMLQAQDIKTLDMRDKFYVKGNHFYIQKIEFSLSHRRISKSYITMIST